MTTRKLDQRRAPPTTRASVLRRAAKGDGSELAVLYAPVAFRMARRLGLSREDAKEVMQETFVNLVERMARFRYEPSRGTFKAYLKTLVARRTADLLKSRERRLSLPPEEGRHSRLSSASGLDLELRRAALGAALRLVRREVHTKTWESFLQTTLHGRSAEAASKALGLSLDQVYQNKSRVSRRLRVHLRQLLKGTRPG